MKPMDRGHRAIDRLLIDDVERMRLGGAAEAGDLGGNRNAALLIAVENGDPRPQPRHGNGSGAADAACTPGDHRYLALEAERLQGICQLQPLHSITSLNGRNATGSPAAKLVIPSAKTTSPSDQVIEDRIPAPSRGNFSAIHSPCSPSFSRTRIYSHRLARFL